MKSGPPAASESTAWRASAALATATDPGQIGGLPSRMCPEPTMRGPGRSPRRTRARAVASQSSWLNISRTPVTPLATSRGRKIASAPGQAAWTCMSQSPGTRNFPVASTIRALAGAATSPSGPTPVIRPPATTTVIPGNEVPLSTSITVAWVKAIVGLACGRADPPNAATSIPVRSSGRKFISGRLLSGPGPATQSILTGRGQRHPPRPVRNARLQLHDPHRGREVEAPRPCAAWVHHGHHLVHHGEQRLVGMTEDDDLRGGVLPVELLGRGGGELGAADHREIESFDAGLHDLGEATAECEAVGVAPDRGHRRDALELDQQLRVDISYAVFCLKKKKKH